MPLFVSRRTLSEKQKLSPAVTDWSLDSGGFTELNLHGGWSTPIETYIEDVRRLSGGIGRMQWAAPQDWMCEPQVIEKTGLSVEEHQRRTVQNFLELRSRAPDLPFIPVIQGWCLADYESCRDMYERAGVDLKAERVVGVGTVCRRQATAEAAGIFCALAGAGLKLHGFGVKKLGLAQSASFLDSADSLAWSFRARRSPPLAGHETRHKNCANCRDFALQWRQQLLSNLE